MTKANLKAHTTKAMRLEEGSVPEAVFVPPAIRGKMVTVQYVTDGKPTDISAHVIRIEQEVDPIGMLIAVVNGQPIPTFTIDDQGETLVAYETLSLVDRIPLMKWFGDKLLPRMSINKKIEPGRDDAWEATLENAGSDDGDPE